MDKRIESLTDEELLCRTTDLVAQSRRVEAELVAHLAEVDARRLYLGQACPSMFVYATSRLGLSDAEAYLRITTGRSSTSGSRSCESEPAARMRLICADVTRR